MSAADFPAPGRVFEVRFGDLAFRLDFHADGKRLTFAAVGGDSREPDQTVSYTVVPLRNGLFLLYWQEAGGTTVTHVEDFENGLVHTNITGTDGSFFNATGTLTLVA